MNATAPPSPLMAEAILGCLLLLLLINGGMKAPVTLAGLFFLSACLLHLPRPDAPPATFSRAALVFGLWFSLATVFSTNPRLGLTQLAAVGLGLLAALMILAFRRGGAAEAFWRQLVLVCHGYLLLALCHFFLIGESGFYFASFQKKLFFTLGHYNHFGALLLFLLPSPFLFPLTQRQRFSWSALLFFFILLTGSRGATGAGLLQLLALAVSAGGREGRGRRLAGVAGLSLVLLVCAMFYNPELIRKMSSGFARISLADARGRDVIWQSALAMAADRPLFGVGPGHYPVFVPHYAQGQLLDAHNVFLGLLAETGWPGLLLFLVLLLVAWRGRGDGEERAGSDHFRTILTITIAGVLVQAQVTSALFRCSSLMLLFWLALAVLVAGRHSCGADRPAGPADPDARLRFIMNGILATIVLYFAILPWSRGLSAYLIPLITALAFTISYFLVVGRPGRAPGLRILLLLPLILGAGGTALQFSLAEAASFRGILAERRGALEEALAGFRISLQLDPLVGPNWLNAGALLWRLGEGTAARDAWTRAAKLMPWDPVALSNLALSSRGAARWDRLEQLAGVERSGYAEQRLQLEGRREKLREGKQDWWTLICPEALQNPTLRAEMLHELRASGKPVPTELEPFLTAFQLTGSARDDGAGMPFTERRIEEWTHREMRAEAEGKSWEQLWYRSLAILARGGQLATLTDPPPDAHWRELERRAWLELLGGSMENAVRWIERTEERALSLHPPPVHFVATVPLVSKIRLMDSALLPATPLWMDDNFCFSPLPPEHYPGEVSRLQGPMLRERLLEQWAECWRQRPGGIDPDCQSTREN